MGPKYAAIVGLAILLAVETVTGQSTATQCQQKFLTNLYGCMQKNGINPTNLFWITRNGTMGVKPENITAFSIQACSVEDSLFNCSLTYMKTLEKDETCPQVEKTAIEQFFRSMFISYDNQCSHPCRETLMQNLRLCYTSAGLDPNLFLSNATMERGKIIGTTSSEVSQFCTNRRPLVNCMRAERDKCPEAPLLMSKIGLDIESLESTVDVLCMHPEVYIDATECFSHPSIGVMDCQQNQTTELLQLGVDTKDENLPDEVFTSRFCEIRIRHVDCDLKAWKAIKGHSCDESVLGLRTELECKLLPDYCMSNYQATIDKICHPDKYNKDARMPNVDDGDDDNGGSKLSVSLASIMSLCCIVIMQLYYSF